MELPARGRHTRTISRIPWVRVRDIFVKTRTRDRDALGTDSSSNVQLHRIRFEKTGIVASPRTARPRVRNPPRFFVRAISNIGVTEIAAITCTPLPARSGDLRRQVGPFHNNSRAAGTRPQTPSRSTALRRTHLFSNIQRPRDDHHVVAGGGSDETISCTRAGRSCSEWTSAGRDVPGGSDCRSSDCRGVDLPGRCSSCFVGW